MRVLMISGDPHLLDEGSSAYARLDLQKAQVEVLDVFVWPRVHSALRIFRTALEKKYDIVTSQDAFWRGLLALMIAKCTGARLHVQVHADLRAQSFLRHVLAQLVVRHADSVRVVSHFLEEQVRQLGTPAHVHVLPIFIDGDAFRAVKRVPHEKKIILWLGRFEKEKNPSKAIEVLKEVRERVKDAELIMLGSGSEVAHLKEAAKGLPVTFPGWQEVKSYLSTADVVLATSKHESWGASIVEALAARVPVVCLDVGIAKEAGARVVSEEDLEGAVVEVLRKGTEGKLQLPLLSKEEWAKEWRESLQ